MIATFDANLLASGLVAPGGGTIASIVEAWRQDRFKVALSEHIYDELVRTLAQPYFTGRVPADAIARYLSFVFHRATLYAITVTISGVATHPEDDLVLASALSARADYLVTATGDSGVRCRATRALASSVRPNS